MFLLLFLLPSALNAAAELPSIFGDHMVLQQDAPLPVWGWADPGEKVSVSFAGQIAETVADADGKWHLKLDAVAGSTEAKEFSVTASNTLKFTDVLVGEVWVASGQSNMAMGKRDLVSKETSEKRMVRFFHTPLVANLAPQERTEGKWVVCEVRPGYENPFSAVAYYFAEQIQVATSRPVGMISSSWGGSGIAPWMDFQTLESSEHFSGMARQVSGNRTRMPQMMEKFDKETFPAWEKKHKEWEEAQPTKNGTKRAPEPKRPALPGSGNSNPTGMFNGMIAPHIPYAIKGALWYQGESNTQTVERSKEYAELLKLLIKGWRDQWKQGDFTFLIVQLPAFTVDRAWVEMRNSQLKATQLPNTGLAVTLDLNPTDNLHPPDKTAVGERLALLALKKAYGENIVSSGPIFSGLKQEKETLRLTFSEIGSGLAIGGPPDRYKSTKREPLPTDKLIGFEIAGTNGEFVPAEAKIDHDSIVISSDRIQSPTHARYAWANYPDANLYNKEGLPASPFNSDDSP